MLRTYLLKKMQRNGCYLREAVQTDSNRSFGVQMLTEDGDRLTNVPHGVFSTWLNHNYIEPTRNTTVRNAPDLRFQYYSLNQAYRFSLDSFDIDVDEVQINWHQYDGNCNSIVTEEDWEAVSELLIREPPLFNLDEILLLSKFLVPAQVTPSQYGFFEQYAMYAHNVETHDYGGLYSSYLRVTRPGDAISFYTFEASVDAFVKLAEIRRRIRNRR